MKWDTTTYQAHESLKSGEVLTVCRATHNRQGHINFELCRANADDMIIGVALRDCQKGEVVKSNIDFTEKLADFTYRYVYED